MSACDIDFAIYIPERLRIVTLKLEADSIGPGSRIIRILCLEDDLIKSASGDTSFDGQESYIVPPRCVILRPVIVYQGREHPDGTPVVTEGWSPYAASIGY